VPPCSLISVVNPGRRETACECASPCLHRRVPGLRASLQGPRRWDTVVHVRGLPLWRPRIALVRARATQAVRLHVQRPSHPFLPVELWPSSMHAAVLPHTLTLCRAEPSPRSSRIAPRRRAFVCSRACRGCSPEPVLYLKPPPELEPLLSPLDVAPRQSYAPG
jgi:hypothetical protein